jgi:hypothetical protein
MVFAVNLPADVASDLYVSLLSPSPLPPLPPSLFLSLSFFLSPLLPLSFFLSLPPSLPPSLLPSLPPSLSLSLSLSNTNSPANAAHRKALKELTLSLARSLCLTHSLSLTLSLSHTHNLSLTHTHKATQATGRLWQKRTAATPGATRPSHTPHSTARVKQKLHTPRLPHKAVVKATRFHHHLLARTPTTPLLPFCRQQLGK